MQTFAKQLLAFSGIQAFILACLLLADPGNSYIAAMTDKHARAESCHRPRMFIVGGSSNAFGIDSPALATAFPGYEPVNLGLHAGLGLNFMLNEVRGMARADDVIVLSPEPMHFVACEAGPVALDLVRCEPGALKHFDFDTVRSVGESGLAFFQQLQARIVSRLRGVHQKVYCREAFNLYGDVVAHHASPSPFAARPQVAGWRRLDRRHLARTLQMINDFDTELREKQVTVVVVHPRFAQSLYDRCGTTMDEIDAALRADLRAPVLNTLASAVSPDSHFYDSEFHLTRTGKSRRTAELIGMLQAELPRCVAASHSEANMRVLEARRDETRRRN